MVVLRVLCNSNKHLTTAVENILSAGGEGVILQKPGSFYEKGRSNSLIKLKV
jgi:DNA ligase 1